MEYRRGRHLVVPRRGECLQSPHCARATRAYNVGADIIRPQPVGANACRARIALVQLARTT